MREIKRIRWLIPVMCVALFGSVVLQAFWLGTAYKYTEKQFADNVNEAMINVIDRLESVEALSIIRKNRFSDTVAPEEYEVEIHEITRRNDTTGRVIQTKQRSVHMMKMSRDSAVNFDSLFADSFYKNVVEPYMMNYNVANSNYKKSAAGTRLERFRTTLSKMELHYINKTGSAKERIDEKSLGEFLRKELENKNIRIPFSFGIKVSEEDSLWGVRNSDKDHLIMFNGVAGDSALVMDSPFSAQVFPTDLIPRNEYLLLQFSRKEKFIYSSLLPQFSLSFLFTALIVAVFIYTLKIIFRQKKMSEIRNDFISNMTHEFKTPIATISLSVDTIANPAILPYPDKVQRYLSVIRQENKRMNSQVEKVLQTALAEKKELHLNKEETNLNELVSAAVHHMRLQVETREGKITESLMAEKPLVFADAFHMKNVIINLIDNASKYSPGRPEITIKTYRERELVLEVADKGVGITKDDQKRIFDKFYRVSTGNVHNVKGFGLGLSYVRNIVEVHGWKIELKSETGKGSTFRIVFGNGK